MFTHRVRALVITIAGGGFTVVAAGPGCATYETDFHTMARYVEMKRYYRALAIARALEPDVFTLKTQDRIRYYFYRGILNYRLSSPGYKVRCVATTPSAGRRPAPTVPLWTTMQIITADESGTSAEVTQLFYALGEARRVRSEQVRFDPPPTNFGETFERRAQALLDAQTAYTDAMRTTDPAWATMAGYRVGPRYQLRYRVLLMKGLQMMEATVRLNGRVGDQGVWSSRARSAKEQLQQALAEENAALAKLPGSEADMQKLLDQLQAKRSGG